MSNAGQIPIFNSDWTMTAVAGNVLSGVVVATIIKTISLLSILAFWRAFFAAAIAMVDVNSPSVTKCLCLMPVLFFIHSSFVSRFTGSSLLEITFFGKYEPTPVISILLIS